MKAFKAFIKSFEAHQRSVKKINSSGIGTGRVNSFENCLHVWEESLLFYTLKLTSQGILYYLWSADLSKSFFQLIVSILSFSQYSFN